MTMAARLALVACLAGFVVAAGAADTESYCPVFYPADTPPDNCETQLPDSLFRPTSSASAEYRPRGSDLAGPNVLEDVFEALEVLQREYYDANYGTWPSAIDWTAAVTQTVLTGTLSTFSKSAKYLGGVNDWVAKENLISSFFAQVVGSYFGQDILSIRGEVSERVVAIDLVRGSNSTRPTMIFFGWFSVGSRPSNWSIRTRSFITPRGRS